MEELVELVKYVVDKLVDNNSDVAVPTEESAEGVAIKIVVNKADMGRVIGKEGRIAKSIRSIVKAAGMKSNIRLDVVFSEKE